MSTISSGTTLTTALVQTGDTTGDLVIKTGSSNTTAMTISGTDQSVTIAGTLTANLASINAASITSGVLAQDNGGTGTTTGYYGFKNRIINGAMMIDQRNAGASVGTASGSTAYITDRWFVAYTQTSKMTVQQNAGSVTPPVGFTNYSGITSSSAYSVLTGDTFGLFHRIEGFNVSDLGWGTANAQPVTMSFWVRSSLTGTFGGALQNSAADRSYPFSYTISSANTWEQKSITIAGDTTGTWLTNNGLGIQIVIGLGSGSTFSGTANAWAAGNFRTVTGATSVVGTNGATFYITGVQLEKGSTATSFDYLDYSRQLQQCQRYYETGGQYQTSWTASGALGAATIIYAVQKRANPTLTVTYISGGGSQPVASATGFTQYSPGSVVGDNARFTFTSSAEL